MLSKTHPAKTQINSKLTSCSHCEFLSFPGMELILSPITKMKPSKQVALVINYFRKQNKKIKHFKKIFSHQIHQYSAKICSRQGKSKSKTPEFLRKVGNLDCGCLEFTIANN